MCSLTSLIAWIFWSADTSRSTSDETDAGSAPRTDDGVAVVDECTAEAFDTAARCGAVVLTDQWSMRSFASCSARPCAAGRA